jgi:hypothetical protein
MKILGFNKTLMSLAVVANIRLMVLAFVRLLRPRRVVTCGSERPLLTHCRDFSIFS